MKVLISILVTLSVGCSRIEKPPEFYEVSIDAEFPQVSQELMVPVFNPLPVSAKLKAFTTSCGCATPQFDPRIIAASSCEVTPVTLDTTKMIAKFPRGGAVGLVPMFEGDEKAGLRRGVPVKINFRLSKIANISPSLVSFTPSRSQQDATIRFKTRVESVNITSMPPWLEAEVSVIQEGSECLLKLSAQQLFKKPENETHLAKQKEHSLVMELRLIDGNVSNLSLPVVLGDDHVCALFQEFFSVKGKRADIETVVLCADGFEPVRVALLSGSIEGEIHYDMLDHKLRFVAVSESSTAMVLPIALRLENAHAVKRDVVMYVYFSGDDA